ncbi:MAG TPA: ATP-binding protein [Chloroflexota bacterium]|nr:ATP-binding protein [Chloroflexota bacterium]
MTGPQLDAILAGVQDGITVQDTAGRLIYANLAAAQMVGFASPEALLAAPLDAVLRRFELFDEHGAPFPVERLPGRLALQGERGHEAIVRYRIAATGDERWAVVRATPLLDAAGRVTRAVNVFQDVTEQRRAEEALRFLAEASRELAGSLDYETTVANVARLAVSHLADWCAVVIAEDGALRVIAVAHADPRQAALARELQERYPFYPELPYGTARVVQTGAPELYPEIDLEMSIAAMKDAEQARLVQALGLTSAMIVPLRTREGCRGAMTFATAQSGRRYTAADLALAQDVADRCALAIENARLYRQAQAAVSQRDEFLSVAAHELKTPVTSLRGFAHVALRQLERDEQPDVDLIRRALAVVDEQTAKLSRLVTRLLDRSRIESGQLALEPAATDLVPLLESVVSAARMTTRQHALELQATGPLVALVDALRLEQVVRNLVDNAIKYSPAGSAIEVELVAPDAEIVRIAVRDYGPGIPPEHRDRIFERFYQVREGKAPAGMGLGLYLSRRIAELHGGQLAAEFPPDGGTRFVLTLPRAGRQGEMAPAAELAHHARDAVQ